jgi:predicted dehydrogenase
MFLEHGYIVINGLLTTSGSYGEEAMTVAKNRTTAPAARWTDEEHTVYKINNSWAYEVRHFLDAVNADRAPHYGSSADALKLMRLIDRIYASDRQGVESRA